MDYPLVEIKLQGKGIGDPDSWRASVRRRQTTGKEVFGLLHDGEWTYMAYHVDDLLKEGDTVFDRATAKGRSDFYFDAGGNGAPVYCSIEELRRVMYKLGLVADDDGDVNYIFFKREFDKVARSFFEYCAYDDSSDDPMKLSMPVPDWWEQFLTHLSLQDEI
jgi:hypothetical protein